MVFGLMLAELFSGYTPKTKKKTPKRAGGKTLEQMIAQSPQNSHQHRGYELPKVAQLSNASGPRQSSPYQRLYRQQPAYIG